MKHFKVSNILVGVARHEILYKAFRQRQRGGKYRDETLGKMARYSITNSITNGKNRYSLSPWKSLGSLGVMEKMSTAEITAIVILVILGLIVLRFILVELRLAICPGEYICQEI